MSLSLSARIARRELRGGLRGFRVFLACLTLGVAAIAAVGLVRESIQQGLSLQGVSLLGGDAEMSFTYRFASDDERAFIADRAAVSSEVVDFRSMAVVGEGDATERALTQVKGVDAAYPLVGEVQLDPPMPLAEALAGQDGLPGIVLDRVLADRLGLSPGAKLRLGVQDYVMSAVLVREPDNVGAGFSFGPRSIVTTASLAGSGLLASGSIYDTHYRMLLPEGTGLAALKRQAEARFTETGMRWRDSRRAAPGVERFVRNIGAFLVLVGLAGLAVGGVGVSAAVRAYLEGKTEVIATLKTLGAGRRMVFQVYLIQIGVLTALGVGLGLVLGGGVPMLLAPVIEAALPFPVEFALYPGPLAEAALYGGLTALIFTVWPLARAARVRAAALYRQAGGPARGWAGWPALIATVLLASALIAAATLLSGTERLALWSAAGIMGSLLVLATTAWLIRRLSRWLARRVRGRVALRLALGAIGGPREEAASVVLSLGLGLSVLAAVGQIDANLRAGIARDLPTRAPSYFFVDIQTDQLPGFLERLNGDPDVAEVETAPMLRGVITRINDRPAREVAGDHWVVRGDRGLTYSALPSPKAKVTAGEWWPEDYSGSPQISFAAEEAEELGLVLGDKLTVNILGRDIEATITSFREVDFSTAGIGFVMSMNPAALAGAPHSHIATVYATEAAEAAILRDLAGTYPNITAIRVRDVIARVTEALGAIAAATSYAAAATLVTGFVVLIGAAAAGEPARVYEAAVLKTLGATRGRILASFALRSAILGAAAGIVAIGAGAAAGWGVIHFVMEMPYEFEPLSAIAIVTGGILAVLLAGIVFALRPLATRPARVLRAQD